MPREKDTASLPDDLPVLDDFSTDFFEFGS